MRNIYLTLILISLVLSIFSYKKDKALYLFPFLLSAALLSDLGATVLKHYGINFFFLYHIYLPLEYGFLAYYFYLTINKSFVKKIILYSIPLFTILSVVFSFTIVGIKEYPNWQTLIECILLIIWVVIALFPIETKEGTSILTAPMFWICIGVLIYQCGIFTYTGMFNYLFKSKIELLNKLRPYQIGFNYILYLSYSIAFICSHRTKKYT